MKQLHRILSGMRLHRAIGRNQHVVLGEGIIDWPRVFNAAQKAGVRWYFIEDESPTSVISRS